MLQVQSQTTQTGFCPLEPRILVAIVTPGTAAIRLAVIDNTPEAKAALVEGRRIEFFPVIEDDETITGICDEEFLFKKAHSNRFNPATGSWICGPFLLAGDTRGEEGTENCSLTRDQINQVCDLFGYLENRELLDQLPA